MVIFTVLINQFTNMGEHSIFWYFLWFLQCLKIFYLQVFHLLGWCYPLVIFETKGFLAILRCGVPKRLMVLWKEGILQIGWGKQRLSYKDRGEYAKRNSGCLSQESPGNEVEVGEGSSKNKFLPDGGWKWRNCNGRQRGQAGSSTWVTDGYGHGAGCGVSNVESVSRYLWPK